jgi:hypothetical protein
LSSSKQARITAYHVQGRCKPCIHVLADIRIVAISVQFVLTIAINSADIRLCVAGSGHRWRDARWRLSEMPNTRKDGNGNHGYVAPVAMIVLLLCGYWVISEWNSLPALISSAIATIR